MSKKWISIFCFIFTMVTTAAWAKPDSAYIDNGNGTVTDIETRLMWQQKTAGQFSWYDAISYCSGLSLAGYSDWRLPTMDELRTLLDRSQSSPLINHMHFPDTCGFPVFYWSSSGFTDNTYVAWFLNFYYDGWGITAGISSKDFDGCVRAVRLGNLVISPLSRAVTKDAGSTSFSVFNSYFTGSGIMYWTAAITEGGDWLSISSSWYDSNPSTNGGNSGYQTGGRNSEAFIKSLNDTNYGGFSDWRMPTKKELTCLLVYSDSYTGPRINNDYFPNTVSSFYWSSTSVSRNPRNAFGMNFSNGNDDNDNKFGSYYVRAVRGGQSGSSGSLAAGSLDSMSGASTANGNTLDSCTDNGDGTVTDTSSGLMWEQAGSSNEMTWEQALAYSEALNCGGYTDWRLPTIKELQSLVDYSRYNPAIDTACFPKAVVSRYWSSTTDPVSTSSAWCIHFNDGGDDSYDKLGNANVRAVRSGISGTSGNLVVSPLSRTVTQDAGTTTFSVSNTGTMFWAAAVTSGGDWLSISSGASGTNAGTVTCEYTGDTGTTSRTGTIQVTAATGSPIDVTVTQAANTTACTAVIDSNYTLHIPRVSQSNMPSYSVDFAYSNDSVFPALILFRLANAVIQRETFTCEAATLSNDLTIHIPDVLMPDGITRIWMDLAYSVSISTKDSVYFYVSNYGVISK